MDSVEYGDTIGVESIPRSDVEEGESYVYKWSPYEWARKNEGYEGVAVVTVDDVSELVGDIKMTTDDGMYLKDLGEGRPQVMGRADNTEDVPDVTDVGRGGRFYPYPLPGGE